MGPFWRKLRIELDFAEGLFVVGDILLKHERQRFGLLRAQIDSLEVAQVDAWAVARNGHAKGEKEIPHTHADLHAVGIAFAIIVGVLNSNLGLIVEVRHGESLRETA